MRRIIRLPEVLTRTGLCASTVYRQEKQGKFPRRVRLGVNSVGWFEDEVDDHQGQLARGFVDAPTRALEARGVER